jgi:hypothetical protein
MFLFVSFSCTKKNKVQQYEEQCFPGSLSILPFGDGNKPPHPLFIRTDETDTTYYKYDVEDNLENMTNIGYNMDKDYFYKYHVNFELFHLLKEYVIKYNTHRNYTMIDIEGDCNTVKIVFEDQCDSISYTVNKSDIGYFSNMIELIKPDEELKRYLSSFQEIQECICKRY